MFDFIKNLFKEKENEIPVIDSKPQLQAEIVRKMVVFTGRVQGVGFRFEAYSVAATMGITGYVKNREDSSVLLEAQGENVAVFNFIEYLSNLSRVRVDNIEIIDMQVKPFEVSFTIEC